MLQDAGSGPSSFFAVPLSRIEPYLLDSLANIEKNKNSLAWLRNQGFYFMEETYHIELMLFKLILLIINLFLFSAKSTQSIFCGPQSDTADLRSGSPSRACGGVGRSCRDCPVTLSPIVHQSYTVDLRSIFNPRLLSFCRDCVCTSGQILLDWSNFFCIFSVRGHANFWFFILFRRICFLLKRIKN